jgi:ribulose-5-phosphate 4-epimerase/fuculose-1-phosphate aldolase
MNEQSYGEQVFNACRALAAHGLGPGIGGHVSVRVAGENRFWTNALDRTFEEMRPEDIMELDFEGNVLSGERTVSPGIGFHPGIYKVRRDVGAIVHTHAFWIVAQSSFARPPGVWHNICTYFSGRTVIAPSTTSAIGHVVRPHDVAIIMPTHGAITVAPNIARAAALHATLDFTCRLDVTLSETAAKPIPDKECEAIRERVDRAEYLELTWELMLRKAGRAFDGESTRPIFTYA